jgi:hypothetical protein
MLATHVRILEILYLAKRKPREHKKRLQGMAPGAWVLLPQSAAYFISPIASTAFDLAVSMFPALQAASASRTSFVASLADEDLAPASDRGA